MLMHFCVNRILLQCKIKWKTVLGNMCQTLLYCKIMPWSFWRAEKKYSDTAQLLQPWGSVCWDHNIKYKWFSEIFNSQEHWPSRQRPASTHPHCAANFKPWKPLNYWYWGNWVSFSIYFVTILNPVSAWSGQHNQSLIQGFKVLFYSKFWFWPQNPIRHQCFCRNPIVQQDTCMP
jgi:hypothetical protein